MARATASAARPASCGIPPTVSRGSSDFGCTRSGGLAFEGLVARLRAEPWVDEVVATGGTLRVVVSDEARANRELLAAAVQAGVPVASFRREPQSIEALISGVPRA